MSGTVAGHEASVTEKLEAARDRLEGRRQERREKQALLEQKIARQARAVADGQSAALKKMLRKDIGVLREEIEELDSAIPLLEAEVADLEANARAERLERLREERERTAIEYIEASRAYNVKLRALIGEIYKESRALDVIRDRASAAKHAHNLASGRKSAEWDLQWTPDPEQNEIAQNVAVMDFEFRRAVATLSLSPKAEGSDAHG